MGRLPVSAYQWWALGGLVIILLGVEATMVVRASHHITHTATLASWPTGVVQAEVTEAHLWFEEFLTGDPTVTLEKVWTPIGRAEVYIENMTKSSMIFESSADEFSRVREQTAEVARGLKKLRELAAIRIEGASHSGIGSPSDQRFDETFARVIAAADRVDEIVSTEARLALNDMRRQHRFHLASVMGLSVALVLVLIAWLWRNMVYLRKLEGEISERHRAEFLADHDLLTGLPNRKLLMDRVKQALARARRNQTRVALLFFDIDKFKAVNDTLGHSAGDRILQQVAGRLLLSIREMDTVARLGGDEFMVVLGDLGDVAPVEGVAKKLTATMSEPFLVDGKSIRLSASIGIACYPDNALDCDTLLDTADRAMYMAKKDSQHAFLFSLA